MGVGWKTPWLFGKIQPKELGGTVLKTNIDHRNDGFEEAFPFQLVSCPCQFSVVYFPVNRSRIPVRDGFCFGEMYLDLPKKVLTWISAIGFQSSSSKLRISLAFLEYVQYMV